MRWTYAPQQVSISGNFKCHCSRFPPTNSEVSKAIIRPIVTNQLSGAVTVAGLVWTFWIALFFFLSISCSSFCPFFFHLSLSLNCHQRHNIQHVNEVSYETEMRNFIKATLAKIKVFKGNFGNNKEGANVHPSNSFFGGKCPPMPYFMGGQMSGRVFVCTSLYILISQMIFCKLINYISHLAKLVMYSSIIVCQVFPQSGVLDTSTKFESGSPLRI